MLALAFSNEPKAEPMPKKNPTTAKPRSKKIVPSVTFAQDDAAASIDRDGLLNQALSFKIGSATGWAELAMKAGGATDHEILDRLGDEWEGDPSESLISAKSLRVCAMGLSTGISWTDATWNPWQGCTKVSPGCEHCYMFRDMKRYGRDGSIVVRSSDATFKLPTKRKRSGEHAIHDGWKVFVCSWSDFFHERADRWRPDAWTIIRSRPGVIFQLVTKRPERIKDCLPDDWGDGWPNVWILTTAENQHYADLRIPELLNVPAAVRGVSIEPMLGPIDLRAIGVGEATGIYTDALRGLTLDPFGNVLHRGAALDWAIAGGESGPKSRPIHPDWVRSLRDQCVEASVAFHFKQWGEWSPSSANGHDYGEGVFLPSGDFIAANGIDDGDDVPPLDSLPWMFRVGVKQSGRTLDGRVWDQFPNQIARTK